MQSIINSRSRRIGFIAALLAITNLCSAQSEQVIRFNGGRDDRPQSITTDSAGSIYVGGSVDNLALPADFAVVKHNAQGVFQWVAHYAASPDQVGGSVAAIATDAAGNVYAAGYIARQITFTTYNIDWLVVSFDSNGVQRWAHVFNSPGDGYDQASELVVDPSGALYVTGISGVGNDLNWLTTKYSLNGAVQWQRTLTGSSNADDRPVAAKLDGNGNLVVLGHTSNIGVGLPTDATLIKYDPLGNVIWEQDFSDTAISTEFPGDLVVDQSGNIYVGGHIQPLDPESGESPFLLKYDGAGNLIFAIQGEGFGGSSVVIAADGNLVVAGTAIGAGGSFVHSSVSKFSPLGAQLWTVRLDPVGDTFFGGKVAADVDGSIYFGGYQFISTGFDFFTAKFASNGQELWRRITTDGNRVSDAHLAGNGDFFITGESDGSSPDMLTIRFSAGFVPPPPPVVPVTPSGLSLTASKGKLTLQWADNSNNESGFLIERSINGGSFIQIAQVSTNVSSFLNTGLNKKNTYAYRVRAFNSVGNSAYSNTATGKPQ